MPEFRILKNFNQFFVQFKNKCMYYYRLSFQRIRAALQTLLLSQDIFCINYMRKLNTKIKINSSRLVTEPASQPSRKMTDNGYSTKKVDTLGIFHDQLMLKQRIFLSTPRRTKSIFNPPYLKQTERRKSIRRELMNATRQIKQLRKELSDKKLQMVQQKQEKKLTQFIDMLKLSIDDRNANRMVYSQRPQAQPIFYPFPMPYPAVNYPNQRFPSSQRQMEKHQLKAYRSQSSQRQNREIQYSHLRSKQREKKGVRLKRNKKRFMKVANAILFTIYLKHYCKRIRQARKISFNELFSSLQSTLASITSQIKKLLKPFFTLLFVKRQVTYDIQKDENKVVLKGKVEAIRRLVLMILQVVRQWMQSIGLNKKVIKSLYYLCRHGNYSCTVPILTPDQLQMTCISTKFGYVSANQNLQNAAFINFLFIKIVIYNILLSTQSIFTQFQDDNLQHNLYIIASVLCELSIDVQDEYMLLVPKSYKIGNSKQAKGVNHSRPLLYKNAFKVEGELISGLKQQSWTKKYFNFQTWKAEKQMMRQIVNTFHLAMVNYHKHVSKKFF